MQGKTPRPRMPSSDPSKSQKLGKAHEPNEEQQRRDQQGQRDFDPVGEPSHSDTDEEEN